MVSVIHSGKQNAEGRELGLKVWTAIKFVVAHRINDRDKREGNRIILKQHLK